MKGDFSLVVTDSLMLKHSNKLSIDPSRVKFKNMTYSVNINDDKSILITLQITLNLSNLLNLLLSVSSSRYTII